MSTLGVTAAVVASLSAVLAACSSDKVTGGNVVAPGPLHYDSLATQATNDGLAVRPQFLSLIVAAMSRGAIPRTTLGRINSNPQSFNIVGLRVVASGATPMGSTQADSVDLLLAWVRYSAPYILVAQVAWGVPGDTLPNSFQLMYLPDSGQDGPVSTDSATWHETVGSLSGSCDFTAVTNNFYPVNAPCTPQTASWTLSTQVVIPPNPDTLPTPISFPSAAAATSVRIDLGSTAVTQPLSADGRVGVLKILGAIRGGRGSR
jgi:hypothetical protein